MKPNGDSGRLCVKDSIQHAGIDSDPRKDAELVGSLQWLARHTRPDCLYAINALYAHPSTTMCSTVEAETHCATSTAVKTSVLRHAMEQLGFPQTDPTTIQEDNHAIAEEEEEDCFPSKSHVA